jgi:hypothetical protein
MFLTVEHLNELTGYKRPAAMRRWLTVKKKPKI